MESAKADMVPKLQAEIDNAKARVDSARSQIENAKGEISKILDDSSPLSKETRVGPLPQSAMLYSVVSTAKVSMDIFISEYYRKLRSAMPPLHMQNKIVP